MAFTPGRGGPGGRSASKLRLRSSHSSRVRLRVSHRSSDWRPPGKEADAIYERDLQPRGARPRR